MEKSDILDNIDNLEEELEVDRETDIERQEETNKDNEKENEKEINVVDNKILDYICKNSKQIFLFNSFILFTSFIALIIIGIEYEHNINNLFIVNQLSKYFLIMLIQYGMAKLVIKFGVKVNYTRKVIHMSYFLWPQLLDNELLEYDKDKYTEFWNVWIILFLLLLVSEEIRNRVPIITTMFKAVDRPEDTPYTLIWFSSQIITTLIVLLPFSVYFSRIDKSSLIFIPILINALADGLAEPVGITFGKHKYKTTACLSSVKYERSYEGSFCVFIVSFIIILCYLPYMYINQFLFCLMSIPALTTITECYSPHTWDSPLITLVVCGLLSISVEMDD